MRGGPDLQYDLCRRVVYRRDRRPHGDQRPDCAHPEGPGHQPDPYGVAEEKQADDAAVFLGVVAAA